MMLRDPIQGSICHSREAMSTQRAIRRLKSDPVDLDLIRQCLELAVRAPTGGNEQN